MSVRPLLFTAAAFLRKPALSLSAPATPGDFGRARSRQHHRHPCGQCQALTSHGPPRGTAMSARPILRWRFRPSDHRRATAAQASRTSISGKASLPGVRGETCLRPRDCGRFVTPGRATDAGLPPVSDVRNVSARGRRGKARDGFGGQEEGQKISPHYPRKGARFAGSEERFAAREPIDPVDQLERRTPRAQSERPARNPAAIRHLHHMAQAVPPQFRAIRQGVRALVRVGANMKIRFKRIVTGVCNSEMAVSAVGYDH